MHTYTLQLNGPLSGTTWVSRYQKGKTNLDFTEGVSGSGISWAPHHSLFYRPDALPAIQQTASKHWRHGIHPNSLILIPPAHVGDIKQCRDLSICPTLLAQKRCILGLWLLQNTHTRLTARCPGLPRWAGTRKVKPIWISLKQETVSGSGISWAICKSAPHSRQITTLAPHHCFLQAGCPSCRPTNSIKALKWLLQNTNMKPHTSSQTH